MLGLGLLLATGSTQAGPPFVTDDPEPVPPGGWEINVPFILEHEINERFELGVELFGNSPKERGGSSELAFNVGGTWKLNEHLNVLFSGGRDIVGDTHAMCYIGLQVLTK